MSPRQRTTWLAAADALAHRLRADERAMGNFCEVFACVIDEIHAVNCRHPAADPATVERIVTKFTEAKG